MSAPPTWYLRLFGSPFLEGGDGVSTSSRVVQRHRVALLALLSLAPGRRMSRDKVISYLWPESDSEHARNLLSAALYSLRKSLGDSAIVSVGDDVRIDAEVVRADVTDFESALERDDPATAMALYRGDFLDGFFIHHAPEFEQWSERERTRLAAAYDRVLEALAESAESSNDSPRAVEWWKARAVRDPCDSRVALRLMQALVASGNAAAALQHGTLHQQLLRSECGVGAAPAVAAFVERVRDLTTTDAPATRPPPEQLVEMTAAPPEETPAETRSDSTVGGAPLGEPAPASSHPMRWLGAAVLVVLALASAAWSFWPSAPQTGASIAVLPFVNMSPDADNGYFADGLTEEIITRLAAIPELKVISRTSAMHYRGSEQSVGEIARELNVTHVLEGSVRWSDSTVRIAAQLVDAHADAHLWADSYESRSQPNFRVQEEIASDVARALRLTLGDQARRFVARRGTSDPEAYELYRRGRFLWTLRTREAHEQAIGFFERAIARDSAFADAYAGLANAYLTSWQHNYSTRTEAEEFGRLRWAAERAIALDNESAEAHVSYAVALWWQKDWPGAERELRHAIALNPGYATARSWYSLLLRGMERGEEAREEARKSNELDPLAVNVSKLHAWQCYLDRDYDCAVDRFTRALGVATYGGAWDGLARSYALKAMFDSALAAARKAVEVSPQRPDFLADLAYIQALAGDATAARSTLLRAKEQPRAAFNIALVHIALVERDSAFVWLEKASWRWPHRAVLGEPGLDPIRSDPRFAELRERVRRRMGMG